MSIDEEKLKMWCEQVDRRLNQLEGKEEPYIEDEDVRKALRWWAVSNGIIKDDSLLYERFTNSFTYDNKYIISFNSAIYDMSEKLISGNTYKLVELCGEGEE